MTKSYISQNVSILIALILTLSACSTIDRGNFSHFKRSLNTKNYGYSIIEDPTKTAPTKMIEKFEVRPGDCGSGSGGSDCARDRERSELSEANKSNYPGSEFWYGWHIYFPEDYPNVYPTKVALGQFHQDKSHPVWMFQNSNGGYHLDDQVHGRTRKYYKLIDESNLRGKWHKIEVHARWAKDESGFFKVYVNGENKVNYTGQTMDAQRVYFKYGIYRSFMSRYKNANNSDKVPAQTVYFSNVKRSKSRKGLLPE
ncbi:polysaccharide lyase [Vibrio salinus]|uniref:polysaccharide lyase n=1 Tax=Vibrio salinus TaxID=2899784 RepID=UPI001E554727|nr:polysaccharide lyase [Vibrio salinus]MCE0495441.1 polysaccharide lyase [Vibrio salinus]